MRSRAREAFLPPLLTLDTRPGSSGIFRLRDSRPGWVSTWSPGRASHKIIRDSIDIYKKTINCDFMHPVSHVLIARMIKFKLHFSFWKKTKCSTLLQMRIGVLCLRLRLQRSRSQRPPPCTEWGVELQRVWSGNSQDKTPLGTTHCELRHRSLSTD